MEPLGLPYHPLAFALAATSCVLLAGLVLLPRPRTGAHWSFAVGMLALAAETGAAYALVGTATTPEDRLFWLRAWTVAALLAPVPWGYFVVGFALPAGRPWPSSRRLAVAAGSVLLLKMLSASAGGTIHAGGTYFQNTDNCMYKSWLTWIQLGAQFDAVSTAGVGGN